MKTVAIIRDRGQLTIPDSIRKIANWATPLSAVTITVNTPDEIVIKPHHAQQNVNWEKIWSQIRKVRAIKGNGKGNLSSFISHDRETRR